MAELEIKEGQWLWMEHEDEVWIPVKPVANYGDSISCEDKNGAAYTIKVSDDNKLRHVQPSSMEGLNDMINLHELFDGAILNTLRDRYAQDKIYTNISSIVIAVNPYKQLPLFTRDLQEAYHKKEIEEPHVYVLADNAYSQMVSNKMPQALIVSGESGSGKTETTKIILRYFSFLSGKGSEIEKKIVDANPIVEAFGNAQTLRNHNSSRFGKWIEIHFDKQNAILGASVKSFLLEVARISSQLEGERNFHFFYQMCAGLAGNDKYALKAPEDMFYCFGGKCTKIEGVDDKQEWDTTIAAMETLNFLEADREDIFAIVAAVLHLGNISFNPIEKGEKSEITPDGLESLKHASRLLSIPEEKLQECMLQRTQKFSKFEAAVTMFFKPVQAAAARDALARFLYSKVFDFVIDYCNLSMEVKDDFLKSGGMIGVLDIFGFECFKQNRFEQLCINYTNEKLQQHFNKHVFVLEQEAYAQEDVSVEAVNFADNQQCIDLIEKAPEGILPMLDEELVLPDGSDNHFAQRLKEANKKNPYFGTHKVRVANQFQVQHYAGSVTYEVDGFMEKNRNEVPKDLAALAAVSTVCNRKIIPVQEEEKSVMGRAAKKKTSIGTQFKNNLKDLMLTLDKSFPHFIRCLKPNSIQGPEKYDAPLVNEQLRYSGVQAVVEIRQQGYPFRIHHTKFYHRYKICSLDRAEEAVMTGLDGSKHRSTVTAFCGRLPNVENEWAVGKTKVLLKAVAQEKLENFRKHKITNGIAKVQGVIRRQDALARVALLKEINTSLELCMKAKDLENLGGAISKAEEVGLKNFNVAKAKNVLQRLQLEKGLTDRLESMMASTSFSLDAANKLLSECQAAALEHPIFNKFKVRIVHEKIRIVLREAIASKKEDQLTAAIDEAVANGLDPEDEENCPVTVQAYRLRLRLQTQSQVEEKLLEAAKTQSRETIKAALKLARNIDLPANVASHAALLEINEKFVASEEALALAVKERDLAALMLALSSEKELGQENEEASVSAKNLLANLKSLDEQLKVALAASDFDKVMEAVDVAEKGQIKCVSLDQAKEFARTHVEVSLKSALKASVQPDADWEPLLSSAIRQANLLDMQESENAIAAVALQSKLKVVQTIRNTMAAVPINIDEVASAIEQAQALDLLEEFEEVGKALEYVKQFRKALRHLQTAVDRRHPVELQEGVDMATKLNMHSSEVVLKEAKGLLVTLSKAVDALTAAVAGATKAALDSALQAAEESELCWEEETYAKARELSRSMSSTEELLQTALSHRRLEDLEAVLGGAKEINLDNPLVNEAKSLVAMIRTVDASLKSALDEGNFDAIVAAMTEAESSEVMCSSLDLAAKWTQDHVRAALKHATSVGVSKTWEDAIPLLRSAIDKAERIEMIPVEQSELLQKLQVRKGLADAVNSQSEIQLEQFLQQASKIALVDETPELIAARKFQSSVGGSRQQLIESIKARNPDQLKILIEQSIKLGCAEGDPILEQARSVFSSMSKLCEELDSHNRKGDLAKLQETIERAQESSLSTECESYVSAVEREAALTVFYQKLGVAVKSRVFEDIEAALAEAASLGLNLQPAVIDAQGLFVSLGKINAALTMAISSGNIDEMDKALAAAKTAGIKGRSFQQATLRVKSEAKFALRMQIDHAMKNRDKADKDTGELQKALQRLRELKIKDWKLTIKAAALLYRSQDQEKAINALKAAVDSKDEQALDKALSLAQDTNLPSYVPAMAAALDYKKQLDSTRENLQKANDSRDLDLLLPAIKSAEQLGIDKNLPAWKEAKLLEPKLTDIASQLQGAVDSGSVERVKKSLQAAEEMKLAAHTTVLVQAQHYLEKVEVFQKKTQAALLSRRFSSLELIVGEAQELKQEDDVTVLDATAMYNKHKKIDEQLRAALKDPDNVEALDTAIRAARDAGSDLTSYKQALVRAEEDIRLNLNILFRKDSSKTQSQIHESFKVALKRTASLGITDEHEIYSRAKEHLKELDTTKDLNDKLAKAFETKNEKEIRNLMQQLSSREYNKEVFSQCQDYLDRLPTAFGGVEGSSDDFRRPLQFVRKTDYMDKRGQKFPYNWKNRYFVLENTVLKYYEEEKGQHLPRGSIVVSQVDPNPKHLKKGGFGFRCGGNRKIHISCGKKEQKDSWLAALHLNLRVQNRIDRTKACFDCVAQGEANIYQLGIVSKLCFLPDDNELESLQQELNVKFPSGEANIRQVMDVCKNWQPEGKEWEDDGFEQALLKYLELLTGGCDSSLGAAARLKELRARKTTSPKQLLMFANACFCPNKGVVDRVTTYFRKKGSAVTYYSFIAGLQNSDNGNLCAQLRLETDVDPLSAVCSDSGQATSSLPIGTMSLAQAQATRGTRSKSIFASRGK
mmetsp:Transcript_6207/g.11769  ORF Transcript_6207/g.11769 Transcript_6207/m.11769 type:complete len:2364 (+) Transcript_6207:38-7129(+)|eukprot:CAMPEP_0175136848 /NCGR_PEP_ID=MMETSP0087-20121206/9497_1 /TAXON_ID=136419 /ORGANISM="Unknown Unknown, Strain D1" /LENGTH=2363 /DNA_ID=CAMNT_0016419637 /DNA_START=33 /DNA_END=7124 /DNA_ORIENTATION=+